MHPTIQTRVLRLVVGLHLRFFCDPSLIIDGFIDTKIWPENLGSQLVGSGWTSSHEEKICAVVNQNTSNNTSQLNHYWAFSACEIFNSTSCVTSKTWSPNPLPIPSVHLMLVRCNSAAKRGTAPAIWASRQACKATFRSTAGLNVKSFVENTLGMEWDSPKFLFFMFFSGRFFRDVFFWKNIVWDIQKNINTSTNSTNWMKKRTVEIAALKVDFCFAWKISIHPTP